MRSTVRDQVKLPAFRVSRAAALTIASGVAVTWDSISYDPFGMLIGSKLIVPPGHGGEWEFEGSIGAAAVLAAVDNYWQAGLYKNGVAYQWSPPIFQRGAAAPPVANVVGRVLLVPGDYCELYLATNNGATALMATAAQTFLSARRIA